MTTEIPVIIQLKDVEGYNGRPLRVKVEGRWNTATGQASFTRIDGSGRERIVPVAPVTAVVREVKPPAPEAQLPAQP